MKTAPVYMPEFDQAFTWAMCRNTMCDNFGIPYEGVLSGPGKPAALNNRYRLDKGSLRCKCCMQSFELKSNIAVRPIARYFLSLSLPFASCPNKQCDNYGYNVYEHHFPQKSPYRSKRRYRRGDGDHNTTCVMCKRQFAIGEPLRIGVELNERDKKNVDKEISKDTDTEIDRAEELRKIKRYKKEKVKSLAIIVEGVMDQRSVTNTLRPRVGLERPISAGGYYARLKQLGARLRDYQSWRNARLLDPRNGISRDLPVRVYTDVLQASLQRHGEDHRYKLMNVIVSVLALENSGFILAVHPYFYPDTENEAPPLEDLVDLTQKEGLTGLYDDWDCLDHPGKIDWDETDNDNLKSDPDMSRRGYFLCSPYAEAAHFMVVDKMLRRFKKVYYYMDAAQELFRAALCALAGPVRSGRVEIALFQHDTLERKEGDVAPDVKLYSDDEKAALLERAFRDMEVRFDNKAKPEKGELALTEKQDTRVRAGLYKGAVKGGRSKKGSWAWLHYPPDNSGYYGCLTLWLTRMPHKTFEDDGKPLLYHATLQPVDSLMSAMRSRVRALSRPEERAKPGRSFMTRYFSIDAALGELWIYLLERNYRLRERTRQEAIPAHKLGLMTDTEAASVKGGVIENDFVEIALDFRLGLKEAGRMTGWL